MVPVPKPDLSHAFTGANPDDYRISRVLMVGACLGRKTLLSPNDNDLLRHAMRVLDKWHLPVAQELEYTRHRDVQATGNSVRIINILPEHGGEDFLGSKERGDMVILCNIARDVDDSAIRRSGNMAYAALPPSLRAAFSSSPDHNNIKAWQDQIAACEAKIVMVTNCDGFKLPELNAGKFVQVALNVADNHMGMMIRRDYLEELEDYLVIDSVRNGDSPLLEVIAGAARNPAASFGYNVSTGRVMEYAGPR